MSLSFIFLFYSCQQETSKEPNLLVGTWKLSTLTISNLGTTDKAKETLYLYPNNDFTSIVETQGRILKQGRWQQIDSSNASYLQLYSANINMITMHSVIQTLNQDSLVLYEVLSHRDSSELSRTLVYLSIDE